jgi:PAS domain S-box-containing protein
MTRNGDHHHDRLADLVSDPDGEALYRQLFEASPLAILLSRPYTMSNPNPAAVALFGYSAEEFARAGPEHFSPPTQPDGTPSREKAAAYIERMLTGEPQHFEWRHVRKDGTEFDAEVYLTRVDVGGEALALATVVDVTERKASEQQRRLDEERFRSLMEHTTEGFFLFEPPEPVPTSLPVDEQLSHVFRGRFVECNDALARMYGHERSDQLIGRTLAELMGGDDDPGNLAVLRLWVKRDYRLSGELTREMDRDGGTVWIANNVIGIIEDGHLVRVWGSQTDVTEMKKAEAEREQLQAQLGQAQKMEAIGRLAGGVAHDFNNMLTVILGNLQLVLEEPGLTPDTRRSLQDVEGAANRSAELTRQLLAFARKQTIAPRVLDLNATVEGMLRMLRRLMGEDIELEWRPTPDLWPVEIDPGQVDQMLANLGVNARDAIAGTGRVTISTANVTVDGDSHDLQPDRRPGDYVRLSFGDDGCGMDPETLDRVFEPFFTTKSEDRGTGLGLSTVYGIVKQNGGIVSVASEPGSGTIFSIDIPRHTGAIPDDAEDTGGALPRGRETILLVEDEPAILDLGRVMLGSLGYTVLAAGRPRDALAIEAARGDAIDLLLTDVVLPGMNGRELAERLSARRPGLRTLYMSGYTANVIARQGILDDGTAFLQKPFSRVELARAVRDTLDQDSEPTV